uniref:Uncharacterized protein n=1 Tax=Panagrellus redivivus TaxID=6233 RepID=A0A7E4W0Q2_PANRE
MVAVGVEPTSNLPDRTDSVFAVLARFSYPKTEQKKQTIKLQNPRISGLRTSFDTEQTPNKLALCSFSIRLNTEQTFVRNYGGIGAPHFEVSSTLGLRSFFNPRTSKFLRAPDFESSWLSSPRLRSFFKLRTSKFFQAPDFDVSSTLGLRSFFEPRTSSPVGLRAPDFEGSSSPGLRCFFEPRTLSPDGLQASDFDVSSTLGLLSQLSLLMFKLIHTSMLRLEFTLVFANDLLFF